MNKSLLKKIFSIILVLIYVIPTFAVATDSEINTWPYYIDELTSDASIVIDKDSSIVLFEKNPNEKLYPASLTKIMTAIIVLDKVNGNYDDMVTFSYNAVTKDIDRASVTIGASAGDQLSVKDCLYSLLLPSANDAANALAEHIAGTINDFVALMNEKAKNLGLENTHFVNPSGLHDDNQYTTASDMAKILQCAMDYPIFLQISSSVSYTHAPIRKYKNPNNSNNQVLNTNSIMVPGSGYYYNGITSGKTGHTTLAGYNLAASAKKNGMHLICIILGGKSEKLRFTEAKSLFDFHFKNYKSLSIKDTDPRFATMLNTISINDVDIIKGLNIVCDENAHITMPISTKIDEVSSKLTYTVEDIYDKYAIGTITYYLNDRVIGKCSIDGKDIEAAESIFTGHLDLSKPVNDDTETDKDNNNRRGFNSNSALIYKNANGKIIISSTLVTMFTIVISIIAIVIVIYFLYTRILSNSKLPYNKILFKIRRFFR